MELLSISARLADEVDALHFSEPVQTAYNPLRYAWAPHAAYVQRYGERFGTGRVLLVGMNPGPFGMMQTGVPFGAISAVRDWMGIEEPVERPEREHRKRPIEGFACKREEVSGARLWGWAQQRFGSAEAFFSRFYVHNCVPLAFLSATGANVTPDKLVAEERDPLLACSVAALRELVLRLEPRAVIGVGLFAEQRAQAATAGLDVQVGRVLHPSPASPAANRGWAEQAERQLLALGLLDP